MFIQSEGLKFLFGIGKFALEQLLKNIVRGSRIIFMQTLQKNNIRSIHIPTKEQ
ncbi:MAG: hypothetical protein RIR48_2717 [Bacteroidota bacterium]